MTSSSPSSRSSAGRRRRAGRAEPPIGIVDRAAVVRDRPGDRTGPLIGVGDPGMVSWTSFCPSVETRAASAVRAKPVRDVGRHLWVCDDPAGEPVDVRLVVGVRPGPRCVPLSLPHRLLGVCREPIRRDRPGPRRPPRQAAVFRARIESRSAMGRGEVACPRHPVGPLAGKLPIARTGARTSSDRLLSWVERGSSSSSGQRARRRWHVSSNSAGVTPTCVRSPPTSLSATRR